MKTAVRQIDRALKRLYNLELGYRAEEFLVSNPAVYLMDQVASGKAAQGFQGVLLVQSQPALGLDRKITLGIYLNDAVKTELETFRRWLAKWTLAQMGAFAVATEEVSHFNYLLFQAMGGRQVTQFELELQGEIDKFMLTFFTRMQKKEKASEVFESIFEQLFIRFRLAEHLTTEQRSRYLQASEYAKRFILHCQPYLKSPSQYEKAFKLLRHFYRLDGAEKVSIISAGS